MTPEQLEAAREAIEPILSEPPRVHLVLGSGLGGLAEAVDSPVAIRFQEVAGFPTATVGGHEGVFRFGSIEGVSVVVQSGRFHLYEGYPAQTVVAPVRLMRSLGAKVLVVTNAVGGIRADLTPGAIVVLRDHLNLQGTNPLIGPVFGAEARFPDMTDAYDPQLRKTALAAARSRGIPLTEGVYAGVLGPSFETPAEVRMLAGLGADVVGMSTVPEVIAARAAGMRCLGFSLVTNPAAGLAGGPLSHEEVMETGRRTAATLEGLVRDVVATLA